MNRELSLWRLSKRGVGYRYMKTHTIFLIVIGILVVGILAYWFFGHPKTQVAVSPSPTATMAPTATPNLYDQSVSTGTIQVPYSSADYTLATKLSQITVKAYIPPCDPIFNYCLFYSGTAYAGTNFESAGLRIQNRTDLTTQTTCLNALPTSYTDMMPVIASNSGYMTAVFSPLGDAGAGHYATGAEYRLWSGGSCYEFETRLGQTQFANYPAGSIKEFTADNQATVQAGLEAMINNITLVNGKTVSFPPAKTQ